jgi:hypothetical protein
MLVVGADAQTLRSELNGAAADEVWSIRSIPEPTGLRYAKRCATSNTARGPMLWGQLVASRRLVVHFGARVQWTVVMIGEPAALASKSGWG